MAKIAIMRISPHNDLILDFKILNVNMLECKIVLQNYPMYVRKNIRNLKKGAYF